MWTEDQRADLGRLRLLLDDMKLLNKATGVLERLRRIELGATELNRSDLELNRSSFILFLDSMAVYWPADRQDEVAALRRLLDTARSLDKSIGMLGALERLEVAACELTQTALDSDRPNFPQFLVSQAFAQSQGLPRAA